RRNHAARGISPRLRPTVERGRARCRPLTALPSQEPNLRLHRPWEDERVRRCGDAVAIRSGWSGRPEAAHTLGGTSHGSGSMVDMTRVLLIGWDGADWRILDPLLESGVLPNLAALIARGGKSTLKSTLPTHSWAAWPSFLTGVDPADHGVFDILESRGGSTRQFPVSFRSIKERTFLADLTAADVETVMANVPLTFPAPAITGSLIAGGV